MAEFASRVLRRWTSSGSGSGSATAGGSGTTAPTTDDTDNSYNDPPLETQASGASDSSSASGIGGMVLGDSDTSGGGGGGGGGGNGGGLTVPGDRGSDVDEPMARSISEQADATSGTPSNLFVDTDSDDEDMPSMQGIVSKWTNYIHGWQDRFLILKDGVLSYYKSQHEERKHCRGTVDIGMATIYTHEFDRLRFDVSLSDDVYYLRTKTEDERAQWVEALQLAQDMGPGLTRRASTLSLASISSTTSTMSNPRSYQEKLLEVKTFRDVLTRQANKLQEQVTTSLSSGRDGQGSDSAALSELRSDVVTFKATTAGLVDALETCFDLVKKREEEWGRKLERAVERRKRVEELYSKTKAQVRRQSSPSPRPIGGPDLEEGPYSMLNEEEFFDALETGLDRLEAEEEQRERDLELTEKVCHANVDDKPIGQHRYHDDLEKAVSEALALADEPLADVWTLAHEDGDMQVYRRETDAGGIVSDQLKAFHSVPGLTAKELCGYFFEPSVRLEWESTVDRFTVLEKLDINTLVFHNLHKRVWPSAQRDACFLSHIRDLGNHRWMVKNMSVEHEKAPEGYVRVLAQMFMLCETKFREGAKEPYTRDDVTCRITYLADVNPGGWMPPSVVRAVSKREYPKFLKNISKHSLKHYSGEDPLF